MRNILTNILGEIESKYPVGTILVAGKQIWPYLRVYYYAAYVNKAASEWGENQSHISKFQRLSQMVKNSFYSLESWHGKYDYIAFSDTTERKNINGKYFNKLLDPIIDALGREKVLYIENPAPSLYPANKVHTKNIVCLDSLILLALILRGFIFKKYMIQNKFMLETIQEEYSLKIDDVKILKSFNAHMTVFNLLFRKIKPKAILLSDNTGYLAAIKAAKDLGIKVIEFQHGAIGKEHPVYNVHVKLDKICFPDYFLVFGRRDLKTFANSLFIERGNVYPVGSFYIEHVRTKHKMDGKLVHLLRKYRRSIGVSLAWITEKHTIEFVTQAAALDKNIIYLLIPRKPQEDRYSSLSLPDNVMIIKDKNFYELMPYVDFHATLVSTCALEAPSLGVQNIFINIDNLSRQYFGAVLDDSRVTRHADTPEEFVDLINTFDKLDRDTICKLNEDIIAPNYHENIRNFVTSCLLA